MLKWLLFQVINIPVCLICYILNPIFVLFANEVGELPKWLKFAQTWDDSCDGAFQVSCAPKFLRYDFNSKYEEHSMLLEEYNRTKYYVTLKEGATFTLWERIQRYFCRLAWLTRNCSYGFSFYVAGTTIKSSNISTVTNRKFDGFAFCGDKGSLWLNTPFTYHDSRLEFSLFGFNFYRNFYLGWKFGLTPTDDTTPTRVMIANRIAWKIRKGIPMEGLD